MSFTLLFSPSIIPLENIDFLISIIEKAKNEIIQEIGPFKNTDFSIKIIKNGGGVNEEKNYIAVSPMLIDKLGPKESLLSLSKHEITHILTYQWGQYPSAFICESVAYWLGGSYKKNIYGIEAHNFVNELYHINPDLPKPNDLLRSDLFLDYKESLLAVAEISSSFAGFLLERFGVDLYRYIFAISNKQDNIENEDIESRLRNNDKLHDLLAQKVKYNDFVSLEEDYFKYIENKRILSKTLLIEERINRLNTVLEYPYWHCFWCWRPNKVEFKKCSYCGKEKVKRL